MRRLTLAVAAAACLKVAIAAPASVVDVVHEHVDAYVPVAATSAQPTKSADRWLVVEPVVTRVMTLVSAMDAHDGEAGVPLDQRCGPAQQTISSFACTVAVVVPVA